MKIVAVESADSPVLSGLPPQRPNRIQGISAGFVPAIYDKSVVDQIVVVSYETALEVSRRLCREEGIFVGISAGAVCQAALQVAKELGPNKRVVALLPGPRRALPLARALRGARHGGPHHRRDEGRSSRADFDCGSRVSRGMLDSRPRDRLR